MKDDFTDDLPLFIYCDEPIAVIVIDNKLIALEETPLNRNTCWLAYHFLGKLAQNELTKDVIPKQIMNQHETNFGKISPPWPCIAGIIDEMGHNRCLSVKLTINEKSNDKIVHLHDFAFLQLYGMNMYVNNINSNVYLTPKEAFILFANICFTASGLALYRDSTENEPFNKTKIKQKIDNHYGKFPNIKTGFIYENYLVALFCLDYKAYLLEQLTLKTISPSIILRLCGPQVLAAFVIEHPSVEHYIREKIYEVIEQPSNLSFNQKICYFTLLRIAEYWESSEGIINLLTENKKILDQLQKELTKEFPSITGTLIDRNKIYKEYLGKHFGKK